MGLAPNNRSIYMYANIYSDSPKLYYPYVSLYIYKILILHGRYNMNIYYQNLYYYLEHNMFDNTGYNLFPYTD